MVNIAMRVISDHVRAISFSIADGQLPSNTGAGYVIRRILRRAVRYGYQSLELKEPFMYRLVPVLANQMGNAFPELAMQKVLIEKVIKEEETSFFRTLELGLKRIDQICIKLNSDKKNVVPGKEVFELYDTFGFPVDLTNLIAEGYRMTIDEGSFNEESLTSVAFSPNIDLRSFSSGLDEVSLFGVTFPTKISPVFTSAPT